MSSICYCSGYAATGGGSYLFQAASAAQASYLQAANHIP